MEMKGKGLIILDVNGTTQNYFPYKDNEEMKELVEKFYKIQEVKDIIIVDYQEQKVYFANSNGGVWLPYFINI